MRHVVVDLEMNNITKNSKARRICTQEIIEIGAVMLDENMREFSSFQTYVKPEYNSTLVPKIQRLTGITNENVAGAPIFSEALDMFTRWCIESGNDVTIHSWSNSDYTQIKKEMSLKNYEVSPAEIPLLAEPWLDFQKEFDVHLGFERQVSLSTALNIAGIDFSGREHNALDDARNTAELFIILNDRELFDKTLRKIEELMKPKSFGLSLGDIINGSMFDVTNIDELRV